MDDLTLPAAPGPWTWHDLHDVGLSRRGIQALLDGGSLRRVSHGVLALATAPDTLDLRLAALRLTSPDGALIVDRTAAWLFCGDMALAPGEHERLRPPQVFDQRPGHRLRREEVRSGERRMRPDDVVEIGGLRVTTPLRTACDLARLERADAALGLLDQLLRHTRLESGEQIQAELGRFRGYRGICQARAIASWADGRAESPGESTVRYWWRQCADLPVPDLQVPFVGPHGEECRLDLAVEELGMAAEYDGEEWHGPERGHHDLERRAAAEAAGWWIEVFDRSTAYGRRREIETRLYAAWRACRHSRRTVLT